MVNLYFSALSVNPLMLYLLRNAYFDKFHVISCFDALAFLYQGNLVYRDLWKMRDYIIISIALSRSFDITARV
jgi:hypothetical protein